MVCDSCPPLNIATLLDNEFVKNVYATPKNDKYCCADCGEDLSEPLAVEILKALRKADTISDLNTIRLRAAYQSLAGNWQGLRDLTCFDILGVAVSASGLNVNVRTDHTQEREMAVTMEDFLEMVVDPNPGRRKDLHRIWAEDTGPSIGGKAPRSNPTPQSDAL
jgi:hypothetical protein